VQSYNKWVSREVLLERLFLAWFDSLERALQAAPVEYSLTQVLVAQALLS
jgi:hypothetical protein